MLQNVTPHNKYVVGNGKGTLGVVALGRVGRWVRGEGGTTRPRCCSVARLLALRGLAKGVERRFWNLGRVPGTAYGGSTGCQCVCDFPRGVPVLTELGRARLVVERNEEG